MRTETIPGGPPRLTLAQTATLTKPPVVGTQKAGYAMGLWTLRRVATLFEQRSWVNCGLIGAWRLLLQRMESSSQELV